MKANLSISVIVISILLSFSKTYAVPACPDPIEITQADGSVITVKLRGDEFFNYKTTLDGYILTPNAKGILTYAEQDANGKLIPTKIKASNVTQRTLSERKFVQNLNKSLVSPPINRTKRNISRAFKAPAINGAETSVRQKSSPITGTPKSLVILVNFSNLSFVIPSPQTEFSNLLNQPGYSTNGGTGSAKDYFTDNSAGAFSPQFDVVGPYTLPQTLEYYGRNDVQKLDTLPQQMVIDACVLANNNGVDFSQYDMDNNGTVDNVFIYYAGYNEAEGASTNTIWPHRWNLPNRLTKFDGKTVFDYACTSELRSKTGSTMCGIGTFCHEFGHVIGLPDYYPTNGLEHHALSYWNIMDSGPYLNQGRTPPNYSAYDRFYLNWITPTIITNTGEYNLDNLSTSNKAYIITQSGTHNLVGDNPNPVEFFTLENRQKTGWDSFLPGHGLLITHIYYNSTAWDSNSPNNNPLEMGVDIVEADNKASDSNLSADPFPGTTAVTSLEPKLRSGTVLNYSLAAISELNGIINFRVDNALISNNIEVKANQNGGVLVVFPSVEQSIQNVNICVYNLLGVCIKRIDLATSENILSINDLPKNNFYIIKVNNFATKIFVQ